MISDLGLEAVEVDGIGNVIGGLAGSNSGSITMCYVTGTSLKTSEFYYGFLL